MRIGEVARRSGVSARMLRHYDDLGLVRPGGRTSAGYRDYTPADVTRIFHVESLRTLGLSLREVGQALDDPDFAPAALVAELKRRSAERIRTEQDLLHRLDRIDESAPDDWEQVLDTVALLAALQSPLAQRRQRAALTVDGTAVSPTALVESLLDEADLNVAGALRWAVGRSGEGVVAPLAAAVHDADVTRRRRAVLALVDTPGPEATDALIDALADPDDEVRSHAALELADRGREDPVEKLVGLVVDGIRDVDAADALALLAETDDDVDAVVACLVAPLSTVDAPARCRIAQALGDLRGTRASGALTELAADDDEMVSRTASYLLSIRELPDDGRND
ncbi:MerR family transcriptional regulator [Gordonia phthalatica]|uniref:MerR family transcriptional regulator n=1 Tax=Gordonia phthalatica TaxID=1136941 RepID=A0A0N9NAS2_9ACTN|nr:MerR family transcriptional regulator [Gordonia phthalatica]ALG85469.1 MerR family transcriptional regulator [Gordonia phthalatica]